MARFFLCLAAAACCCLLALLVHPVQGRPSTGLASGGSFGGRDHPLSGPHVVTAEELRGTTVKAKPSWSSSSWTAVAAAGGRVRPELRSVPGGPDPLHHHGSPWRPELEQPITP
uniref:Uncharacterized protein n=1 Tax=Setaria viridis TaxID=4556 RepID=A0A4U6TGQ5_SETVI|nr:protein FLORAL ORGAN NUMBER2-like [Setaria viridis]TKW01480.1 hypothetical protein SEVIR_8G183800v2 [Setaria viridis]